MKRVFITTAAIAAMVSLSACGKMLEPYQDAERGVSNSAPADTLNFPDGFSNAATKCDNGNRVYVLYHGDAAYGSIAVVPQDPSCKAGTP